MTILWIIIGLVALSYGWGRVLSWLNLRAHGRDLPESLKDRYDADKYAQSYDYHLTNYRFSIFQGLLSFILTVMVLAFGWFGELDGWLRANVTDHAIGLPLVFFGVIYILSDVMSWPFQWYHTFVIEEKFGFNKMTPRLFVIDKLKGYLMGIILGGVILGALLWLVDSLGEGFWIWFWVFISAFMLFMTFFYTSIFLPIFNKLTPLEEGELRAAILKYAQSVNFPLDNIFVMDGSKRSAKANAFFSGFGKQKKIVLYDTLIEKHSQEELVAVLAHEVGHYKRNHVKQSLVLSLLQTGVMLFVLSRFVLSPELSYALGGEVQAIHLNLIAFGLLFSPISSVLGVGMNLLSRKNEYEADHYAATTYAAAPLGEALIKLNENHLSNLTPHPWHVFLNYSHPTLLQRLAHLKMN